MAWQQPKGLLAGFIDEQPDPSVPELTHCGEQWLPGGQAIGAHRHGAWEFYYQAEGSSEWRVAGRTYLLHPGELLAVPAGVRHEMRRRPGAAHHYFFAGIHLAAVHARHPAWAKAWRSARVSHAGGAEIVHAAFRALIREVLCPLPHRTEGIRLALDRLVLDISRLDAAASAPPALPQPAVARACELLDHHPEKPWRLRELAGACGVSPSHLARCFKAATALAPRQYLLRRRVERARELLRQTDRRITDIALDLGFASSQHFARVFRQHAGATARHFRLHSRRT